MKHSLTITDSKFINDIIEYFGMLTPEYKWEQETLGRKFLTYTADAMEIERFKARMSETKFYAGANLELRGYDSLDSRGDRAHKLGLKKFYIVAPKCHLEDPWDGEGTLRGLLEGYKGNGYDKWPYSGFVLFVDDLMFMPSSPIQSLDNVGTYKLGDMADYYIGKLALSVRKALIHGTGTFANDKLTSK